MPELLIEPKLQYVNASEQHSPKRVLLTEVVPLENKNILVEEEEQKEASE